MRSKYLLGVDIGTQGAKAAIVTTDGRVVATGYCEYSFIQPFPGWAEQWPQVWEEAVYCVIREAIEKAKISPSHVVALCFSGLYGGSGIPVDREMKPLRPCIIWLDRRAVKEVEWIKENIDLERLFKITGNFVDPYFGYTKILWIKRHEPHTWGKIFKFLPPTSYIEYRMTGKVAMDFSSAGNLGGLFDLRQRVWSEEMSKALGIPLDLMPEQLVPSTEVVGELLPAAASKCGLVPGTPVVAGGIDAAVATLSAGAVEPGDNVAMIGTSTCWGVIHGGERLSPNLVSMPHVVNCYEEIYTWGGSATSGAIVRWFRDNLGQLEKEAGINLGLDPYELLDLGADKVSPGSDGLLVLPYFMGERAPLWDPRARGAILGLTLFHTKAHLFRAFLEATAYSLRYSIETGEKTGLYIKPELRLVGGAAKSRLWPQIIADVLERPVYIPLGNVEAPLGDALLAGLGIREISNHRVILEWIKSSVVFYPNETRREIYCKLYQLYKKSYEQICEIMHYIADMQAAESIS